MVDGLIVGLIVAAAAGYVIYRYFFKKSGGCSCGCGSNMKNNKSKCCGGDGSSSPCDCGK